MDCAALPLRLKDFCKIYPILFFMKIRFLLCGIVLLSSLAVSAGERRLQTQQQSSDETMRLSADSPVWYAGVGGGIPFGMATFTSFGSDGIGIGWSAEAFLGRRFTAVTSAEVSVSAGRVSLSARDCCAERGYWLGSDGIRYNAPVVDKEGWNYADLRSSVSVFKLDARLNVNLLGLVNTLKDSPWTFEVSPAVSVLRAKSGLSVINSKESAGEDRSGWNFGIGARLQLGCQLGKGIGVSLYSGATCLFGEKIDGVPVHQHRTNLLIENGLRLNWTFGGGND